MATVGSVNEKRELNLTGPAKVLGLIGLALICASFLLGFTTGFERFFRSYLLNHAFFLTIALGALVFVLIQHVSRAGWSVVVRRLAEIIATTIPYLGILFVPMLIPVFFADNMMQQPVEPGQPVVSLQGVVYPWASEAVVAQSELLQLKTPYLNRPFWLARIVIFFAIWSLIAWWYFTKSREQDRTGDWRATRAMEWASPISIILFAFTITFFGFDTIMSLHPEWFSTIFGVYLFAGAFLSAACVLAVLSVFLPRFGYLDHSITVEHRHDLGKWMFAFVVFWAYIAFSQYMLIWYGDIPEETFWYRIRQDDAAWLTMSLVLLFGHFIIPFLGLISRSPKRRKGLLVFWAVWLLALHYVDLMYLILPTETERSPVLTLTDFTLLAGFGAVFLALVAWKASGVSLLPAQDPRLSESLAFENM